MAQPDSGDWAEFMEQFMWAKQTLYGNGGQGQGGWDPMGGGDTGPGMGEEQGDPFGATKGPNGNWILNHDPNEVGFTGGDKVYDIFGPNNTIHVDPYSARVTVTKVLDESVVPASFIYKVYVFDEALGEGATFLIHDIDSLNELNLKVANLDKVDIQVDDERIHLEKFEEGGLGDTPGTPDGLEPTVEDGMASWVGMGGNPLRFYPPYGDHD